MVDRARGRFAAWYEMFPRSHGNDANRHGTFDDVIARLPYVQELGFDVLYFPPIHPIGTHAPQGPQQHADAAARTIRAAPMPSARPEGGHNAHPSASSARSRISAGWSTRRARHGLEIALDFAIQCSPDHPWIKEHPEWFDWRPDGTIKYAENPPKKYEDIVNVHFYRDALPAIWLALRDIVLFWVEQGVRIFRVDNPHTKPFPFWEWLIARGADALSRRDLPGRGLHPPEGDAQARQDRLHAVLHLLHLAQHQGTSSPST